MEISQEETELMEEIQELRRKHKLLRQELQDLESEYYTTLCTLQELCGKKGHDFLKERDDDYHNSRFYYTCKRCDFFTRYN